MLKMDLSQQQIGNLEARMVRIERKFQLLEAGFNKKISWIMNNVVLKRQLLNVSTGFQQQQQPLIKQRTKPRILSHPKNSRRHRITRFILPQVQYGNDNDDNNEDQDGQQNYNEEPMDQEENNWAQQQNDTNENDDEDEQNAVNNINDKDNDNEEYLYYEDGDGNNAQSRSEDPLAIDDEKYETTKKDGQDQGEEQQNTSNPWRFNLTAKDNNEEDQTEEDNFNLEGQNKMIRRRNFLDIKPFPLNIENSRIVVRQPIASSNNAIKMNRRRLLINSFRAIQPKTSASQLIVPKSRYLMSNAAEARLKNARLSDTTLESNTSYVKLVNPQSRGSSLPTPAPDRKEKVYYCDRCPLTFTLSTRHAHNELHKKMDLKQQQVSLSPSQNFRSDLSPIGSSSPLRNALKKGRTKQRTRPRKLCPICTKSYSRNQYLRNHMIREHANDYPYICKVCFSVFNYSSAFEQHLAQTEKCFKSLHQNYYLKN